MQEMWVQSLGQEDPLEKEMTTYSSILAWEISRAEEPGGQQSMGSQKSQTWLSDKTTPHNHISSKFNFAVCLGGGAFSPASRPIYMPFLLPEMSFLDWHILPNSIFPGLGSLSFHSKMFSSPPALTTLFFFTTSLLTFKVSTLKWVVTFWALDKCQIDILPYYISSLTVFI